VDRTDELAPRLVVENSERSVVAADMNNDGYPDIVRTDEDLVDVLLNQGPDGSPAFRFGRDDGGPDFTINRSFDTDLVPEGLGVLDYDGDGWLDIVHDNDGEIRVMRNPADGTAGFVLVPSGTIGLPTLADLAGGSGDYITVVDFDLDGFVDIHARNAVIGVADLYRNLGDGTFAALPAPDLDTGNRGGIAYCDFDNDGDFDFFYGSGDGAGTNRVWLQIAPVVFEDSGQPDPGTSSVDGVACGDIDNDGDEDLYLSRNGDDQLFINQLAETGALGWVRDNRGITASENGEGVVMVDFDMDGDLDIYVAQTGPVVTDPMTMMSMPTPTRDELWRNDLDSTAYLAVTVLAEVRTCPDTPVRRVDTGAAVRVAHRGSSWQSGWHEINGGSGHGTQGSPILHFGLPMGATQEHDVTVRFQHAAVPDATIRVIPASLGDYQHLTILAADPDGDGISTLMEMEAIGDGLPDADEDGLLAWHDLDSDGDGASDLVESGDRDFCTPPVDSDGDGTPDFLQPDLAVPPDGGALDGGVPPGPTQLEVHGSGLLCTAVRSADRRSPTPWLLCFAVVVRARRRRLTRRPDGASARGCE
jgi:hypothetical protein